VAAVVVLERSDRETIQGCADLLRGICKSFSIPIMIVVGGGTGEDALGLESPLELVRMASKITGFARVDQGTFRAS
jgi:hypothetical protein